MSVHQDRWDGHPPPLLPPRATRLPAPVTPPKMRSNRPTAGAIHFGAGLGVLPPRGQGLRHSAHTASAVPPPRTRNRKASAETGRTGVTWHKCCRLLRLVLGRITGC